MTEDKTKVKKRRPASSSDKEVSFEESLGVLESIVSQLEHGNMGLADSLQGYEEGAKHLKNCYRMLEKAEHRIELLSGVDADGNPIGVPFDDAEGASLDEKSAARVRRRSNDLF